MSAKLRSSSHVACHIEIRICKERDSLVAQRVNNLRRWRVSTFRNFLHPSSILVGECTPCHPNTSDVEWNSNPDRHSCRHQGFHLSMQSTTCVAEALAVRCLPDSRGQVRHTYTNSCVAARNWRLESWPAT
jgi:hypothetical protein